MLGSSVWVLGVVACMCKAKEREACTEISLCVCVCVCEEVGKNEK